jgi:hypothetical protein
MERLVFGRQRPVEVTNVCDRGLGQACVDLVWSVLSDWGFYIHQSGVV